MKVIATLLLSTLLMNFCTAQKTSNVDFDAIKKKLEDTPALYDQLLDRFKQSDTTLSQEEFNLIYFGQCFQKTYNPYSSDSKNFEKFRTHYQEGDFEKALPIAMKMLEKNPLDLKMTFKALICNHQLKNEEGIAKLSSRYKGLLLSIIQSGDGKAAATAFVVMCVSDEYELMANMQVENTMQSLQGDCDVMTLKENDLGLEKLYFNVSKPLGHLVDMMKGK